MDDLDIGQLYMAVEDEYGIDIGGGGHLRGEKVSGAATVQQIVDMVADKV
jgi:hypothetical protein